MKLLLDEMLAPQIARTLRDRGHDVVAIRERSEWVASSDDEVFELARRGRRAIVTNNVRDFRPRAAAATIPGGAGHHGMVFIPAGYRRTRAEVGRIVTALEAVLGEHPGETELENLETWLR